MDKKLTRENLVLSFSGDRAKKWKFERLRETLNFQHLLPFTYPLALAGPSSVPFCRLIFSIQFLHPYGLNWPRSPPLYIIIAIANHTPQCFDTWQFVFFVDQKHLCVNLGTNL